MLRSTLEANLLAYVHVPNAEGTHLSRFGVWRLACVVIIPRPPQNCVNCAQSSGLRCQLSPFANETLNPKTPKITVGLKLCWHVVGSPTAKPNPRQVGVGHTPTVKCDNLGIPNLTNRSRVEIQTSTCVPINRTYAILLRK